MPDAASREGEGGGGGGGGGGGRADERAGGGGGGGRGGRLKLESSSRKWWEGRKIGINGGTTTIRDGPIGKERRGSIRFRLAPSCGNETHRPLSPLSSLFDLRDRPPRPQLL